jgi:hypothetical protein
MSYDIEQAMRETLDGRLFKMVYSKRGPKVVDLLADVEPSAWPRYESMMLLKMKRNSASWEHIGVKMGRPVRECKAHWARRDTWARESMAVGLKQEIASCANSRVTVAAIIRDVVEFSDVPIDEILSLKRKSVYVDIRQAIFWLAHKLTNKSYVNIGLLVGRDHSTVLHGVNRVNADPERYAWIIGPMLERFSPLENAA